MTDTDTKVHLNFSDMLKYVDDDLLVRITDSLNEAKVTISVAEFTLLAIVAQSIGQEANNIEEIRQNLKVYFMFLQVIAEAQFEEERSKPN